MNGFTKAGVVVAAAVLSLVTVGGVRLAPADSGTVQANWMCC